MEVVVVGLVMMRIHHPLLTPSPVIYHRLSAVLVTSHV